MVSGQSHTGRRFRLRSTKRHSIPSGSCLKGTRGHGSRVVNASWRYWNRQPARQYTVSGQLHRARGHGRRRSSIWWQGHGMHNAKPTSCVAPFSGSGKKNGGCILRRMQKRQPWSATWAPCSRPARSCKEEGKAKEMGLLLT